ncbi:Histidine protein kinase AsgD [Myxococcus hansupus]|uniref:histidine kinase n=1 Tax=Pseudomyxococcus hansupus TaxID=1297742 RepID=A0A0H4XG65_9BACT|nr:PAS domain-containing protein [Myxococcus hansupus]AKQ67217.1 Histidine protein kinase AsgD [Myxococcus hansupus]
MLEGHIEGVEPLDDARVSLDTLQAFVALLDAEGRLLDLNQTAMAWLRATSARELRGHPFWLLPVWRRTTGEQERLRQAAVLAARGVRFREDVELRHVMSDSEARVLDLSLAPVRSSRGVVTYVLVEGHDVTERKQAEAALTRRNAELEAALARTRRPAAAWHPPFEHPTSLETVQRSEERYRCLVDAMAQVVWTANTSGDCSGHNQAWSDFTGQTEQAALAQGWLHMVHAEDRERVCEDWRRALESHSVFDSEYRVRRPDGRYTPVHSRAVAVREADGTPREWVGTLSDITERTAVEAELRESQARFQAIIDAAPAAIYVKSPDGRLLMVNRFFTQQLGRSREQLLGRTDLDLFPPEQAAIIRGHDVQVLTTNQPLEVEEPVSNHRGARVFRSLKFPLRSAEGVPTALGGISTDVTEKRRIDDVAKRLLDIVGHDLRSPTAAILTTTGMLRRRPLDEAMRRPFERIHRSARRVEHLLQVLMDFTQAQLGGGIQLEPIRGDLRALVAAIVEDARTAHPEREVRFIQRGEALGDWDPERLERLLGHLLDNAFIHGAPDTPIDVLCLTGRKAVLLGVRNQGVPIPPEVRATLFEPIRRASHQAETVRHSLGLSLYLVRELTRAHQGRIRVASTALHGTTFYISLPRPPT